ncbi:hypothetical protein HMN09_00132500 [Mycena chlorophos]|uniref:Methyltransferase domain-containing protein n=1 Tax=Mycena chlorophos TaxID=658473 RepID=A0A8H6TMV4_MYCCL|nr:hypothetical protein HMN09_00132500 [Mycena chlorophos]
MPAPPALTESHRYVFDSLKTSEVEEDSESARLDAVHTAFTAYFSGNLIPPPLDDRPGWKPVKILELGCGHGSWAIHAAKQYPEAEIIAIDIADAPKRPLPPNVRFIRADMTKDLPSLFPSPISFDLIHIRFVLTHLPQHTAQSVIRTAARLLTPSGGGGGGGGLLLLEEGDTTNTLLTSGPAGNKFWRVFHVLCADADVGSKLSGYLRGCRAELPLEVKEYVLFMPAHSNGDDQALTNLGTEFHQFVMRTARLVAQRSATRHTNADEEAGFTEELLDEYEAEVASAECKAEHAVYFCSARRLPV